MGSERSDAGDASAATVDEFHQANIVVARGDSGSALKSRVVLGGRSSARRRLGGRGLARRSHLGKFSAAVADVRLGLDGAEGVATRALPPTRRARGRSPASRSPAVRYPSVLVRRRPSPGAARQTTIEATPALGRVRLWRERRGGRRGCFEHPNQMRFGPTTQWLVRRGVRVSEADCHQRDRGRRALDPVGGLPLVAWWRTRWKARWRTSWASRRSGVEEEEEEEDDDEALGAPGVAWDVDAALRTLRNALDERTRWIPRTRSSSRPA